MKLNFKEWNEDTVKNKRRLVVYDFDGTIANVPEKPSDWSGKQNGDWWSHPLSLSSPNYNNEINHEVVESFKKDKADPGTHVILLTGRRGEISPSVRNVLRTHGLFGKRVIPSSNQKALNYHQNNIDSGLDINHPNEKDHEEYYSGDHTTEDDYPKGPKGKADGSTLAHKIYIIRNKMMHPGIEQVEFWDDRSDHIPHFIKLGLDLLKDYGVQAGGNLKNVILHRVYPPMNKNGQGVIQHIPIKFGMNH